MKPSGSPGIDPQKVELVLAQLDSLPSLAPVATRILALTGDSSSNANELVELIETDPSLTARVLSMLGRADLGVRPEAVTVRNAVLLLGFEAIRHATLALKVMDVMGPEAEGESRGAFDRFEFWKHCLGVACAARRIAMVVPCVAKPEEAFVLGLLHDIGKVAINTAMPKSHEKIIRVCSQKRADIADIERSILGVDHTVVGHRLAQRWGLPEKMAECIWLHHHAPAVLPASVASGRHVQIVQLADAMVREQRIGYSGNHVFPTPSRQMAAALGLPEAEHEAILETLADEIEARATWIGVEEITSREVYFRALMAASDELAATNVTLIENNRRLQRRAGYFSALCGLNRAVSPKAPIRDVCAAGAETLRHALGRDAAMVFVISEDGRWIETGFSDGTPKAGLEQRPDDAPETEHDERLAVQLAIGGAWLSPPGRSFDGLIDRYRGMLGNDPIWMMPIVREQQWVAGAVFSASGEAVASLRGDTVELEALSAAIGLAIAQSRAQSAAVALADELSDINRHLTAMQTELVRGQALETVASMAAGAAHEMNNPLSVISVRAQMLRDRVEEKEVRESLETIIRHAHSCSDIVADLMDFAQPRPPRPEPVNLRGFLDHLIGMLVQEGLLATSDLSIEIPSDIRDILFDREQLASVFRDILNNAAAATDPSSRCLTVKAAPDLTEENIVVTVEDNGCGMTMEVLARAIDPFFSHRRAGRGRGLGLARVHRFIRQNGGTMRLDSEPSKGTRVELRLPATDGTQA